MLGAFNQEEYYKEIPVTIRLLYKVHSRPKAFPSLRGKPSVAHEQSVLEPCSSRACSSDSSIRSLLGSSTLEHNRVIPREVPRDFHVIFT